MPCEAQAHNPQLMNADPSIGGQGASNKRIISPSTPMTFGKLHKPDTPRLHNLLSLHLDFVDRYVPPHGMSSSLSLQP